MDPLKQPDPGLERRTSFSSPDLFIRAGLVGVLAWLCYQAFSPFVTLAVASIILAITLYPVHQWFARRLGGRQGLASTILVILGALLIVTPTALLMNSFADQVRHFTDAVQRDALKTPPPAKVEKWPVVGEKLHDLWSKAHADLPGLVKSLKPKTGDLARKALSMVASIASDLLRFLLACLVASIGMAYGESASRSGRAFFARAAGTASGEALATLSTATIRAVALGVVGVASIQAILIGLALLLAGVPAAGVLSIIALVLGIAQVPALIVTLPVVVYIWSSGNYSNAAAVTHTIILLVAGMADNVLKPLMIGRGVTVPMPVILFGALGGMASGGIVGMFVGATALALGFEIVKSWVAANPDSDPAGTQPGPLQQGAGPAAG